MRLSDLLKTADKPTLTPEQVREGQARIREMRARRGAGKAAPYERGKPLAGGTADQLPQAPASENSADDAAIDADPEARHPNDLVLRSPITLERAEQEREAAKPENFGKDVKVWDESMGPKHPVPVPEPNKYEGRFDYLKRPGSSELMGRYDPEKRTAQPMFYREEDVPQDAPSEQTRKGEQNKADEAHMDRARANTEGEKDRLMKALGVGSAEEGDKVIQSRMMKALGTKTPEETDEKMKTFMSGLTDKQQMKKLRSLGFGELSDSMGREAEQQKTEDRSYDAETATRSRGAFHEAIKKDEVPGWYNPKFAPQEIRMPAGVRASLGAEHGQGAYNVKFYERPPGAGGRMVGMGGEPAKWEPNQTDMEEGFQSPGDTEDSWGISMPSSSRTFVPRVGPHAGRAFLSSEARLGDAQEGAGQSLAIHQEGQEAYNAGMASAAKVRAQRYEQMAPQPAAEMYPGERRDFARDVFSQNHNSHLLTPSIWGTPNAEETNKSLNNIWRTPEQEEKERDAAGPIRPRAFPPPKEQYGIETGHPFGSAKDTQEREHLAEPWGAPSWWEPPAIQGGNSSKDRPSGLGADATKSKPLPKFDPGADNTKSRELPRFEPKKFEPEDPTKTEAPEEEDSDDPAEREESSKFKPADKGATKHAQLSTILESAYCLSLSKTAGKPGTPNLVFVRGLPGAGKSTWAAKHLPSHTRIEADQFFEGPEGYKFDPARIGDAHADAKARMVEALTSGKDVTVANTFTKKWELDNYLEALGDLKPKTRIFSLGNTPKFQSVHGVPEAALKAMAERWEAIPGERLLGKILKSASEKPIRHRVDVLAMRDGHVLTGKFKDGESHGFFGGGIDEGESPTAAAVRELAEESGFVGENARLLPIKPYLKPYVAEPGFKPSAKMKARTKEYSGTMTHYVAVDVAGKDAKPGTDHKHSFDPKTIGFRPIEEAMPLIAKDHNPERGQVRLHALLAAAEPMQKAAAENATDVKADARARASLSGVHAQLPANFTWPSSQPNAAASQAKPYRNLRMMEDETNEAAAAVKTSGQLIDALRSARQTGHISGRMDFSSRPAQATPDQILERVQAMRTAGMSGGATFRNLNKVSALGMLLAG